MPRKNLKLITGTGDDRPIYVAGSFNDWRVAEETHRLEPGKLPGHWKIALDIPDEMVHVEYKYTRGGWEGVELGQHGENAHNHRRRTAKRWSLPDRVVEWASTGLQYKDKFLPRIEIINEAFEIPQLIRTRRVAALLPHDYYETDRRYPVLYLQDGQNLYDDYAPYGSWGVDKQLAAMSERGVGDIIIVAIDHANDQRVSEFTPSFRNKLGVGEGKKYCGFLAKTLKPYVDQNFRTLPESKHTGIGGSSLGGLVSVLAGIHFPDVYERLMIFSPAFWVAPELTEELVHLAQHFNGKVYLYGGEAESNTMVPNMMRFLNEIQRMSQKNLLEFRTEIDPHGQHNEARWGKEFPRAVEWLF